MKIKLIEDKILRTELFKILVSNSLFINIALIINVLVITVAFWDITEHNLLITWTILIFVSLFINKYYSNLYTKNSEQYSLEVYEQLFSIPLYIANIIFSIGIISIFPTNLPFYQTFLAMTITAVAAVAVMSLSSNKVLIINYLVILVLPLISIFSLESSYISALIVILYSIFLVMLIIFAKKYNESITELIISKFNLLKANERVLKSEDHFITIFEQAPIGIFIYNKNLEIIQCNKEFEKLLILDNKNIIGKSLDHKLNKRILPKLKLVLRNNKEQYEGVYYHPILKKKIWINIQISPLTGDNNTIINGLAIVTDITKRVQDSKLIHHHAFYDSLTQLANRITLNERIEHNISLLQRNKRFGALLFIDMDNFKNINDSLGHDVGDEVLIAFSKRVASIMRKEDTFARLGGDEFVIMLGDLSNEELMAMNFAYKFANKIHELNNSPLIVNGRSLNISLSIGVSLVGLENQTKEDILKYADIAMYEAKADGKNSTKIFKNEMSQKVINDINLNNELIFAIKNEEFEIYYQPIVNIKTHIIESCEALIRWNHPSKGLIFPDAFIPFAEKNDLLLKIGDYVIEQICKQYNQWNKLENTTLKSIAVNISPKQFNKDDFEEKLINNIKKYNVNPKHLKLELTESVIVDNLDDTVSKIVRLKDIGFEFSMDDFGTGYSSLSYLKNLPFNYLKVDQSFIKNILHDENDIKLVKTIATISKQFGFLVIAEGVETKEHVEFLETIDCNYYQGYVTSKAVNSKEFITMINNT